MSPGGLGTTVLRADPRERPPAAGLAFAPPAGLARALDADGIWSATFAYLVAAAIGLALTLHIFPLDYVLGVRDLLGPPDADIGQNVVVQRYFFADAWRWPPLTAANLAGPEGTNIGLIDGVPLLALPLKLMAGLLPMGFHGIGLWTALVWLLQPVAAVWCLRGTGVRGPVPAVAVAAMAASMPAWWNRFGHPALCGHFLLLLFLGCYLRLVARPGLRLWLFALALQVAALLTQPYLAVMGLAVMGAVPLTLLLRRDRRWPAAALGIAASLALFLGGLWALDYLGVTGGYGFGEFQMDALAPFWPGGSALNPWPVQAIGPWEGYNYLGAGLLLGLLALLLRSPAELRRSLRYHAGLALAMLCLTLFAISQRPSVGGQVVADLSIIPDWLENLRSTGRFFWPVAYTLLIFAVAQAARLPDRRLALLLLPLMAVLQFADVGELRHGLYLKLQRPPAAWRIDAPELRALLADARSVTLLPTWYCVTVKDFVPEQELLLETLLVASETAVPASTMDVPRRHGDLECHDEHLAAAPLGRGEVRVLAPAARASYLAMIPDSQEFCRELGAVTACRDYASTAPLPTDPPPAPPLRPGRIDFIRGGDGLPFLGRGWSDAEDEGIWSVGGRAEIRFERPPELRGKLALQFDLQAIAAEDDGKQRVEVWLDGERLERWTLRDRWQRQPEVELPPGGAGPVTLELWIDAPTRPVDRGLGNDPRLLGVKLRALTVAPMP